MALLAYLVGFMEQGAVQYRAWLSREQSWRDGFCMGVRDAFETQNQENPGYELMLAIPAEVMEAYEKLNIKKGPSGKKRTRAFSDGSAFDQGGKQRETGSRQAQIITFAYRSVEEKLRALERLFERAEEGARKFREIFLFWTHYSL